MKILIVDDEDDLTFALKSTIEELGYEVESADSGEEALEKFPHFNPSMIITDRDMPGISGIELAESLRQMRPDIKIILYTGNDDIKTTERKYFYRIFKKPASSKELGEAIQELERRI